MKTRIEVFVTKTGYFRARVEEPCAHSYEVTIGGQEWKRGKGGGYQKLILEKAHRLSKALNSRLEASDKNFRE